MFCITITIVGPIVNAVQPITQRLAHTISIVELITGVTGPLEHILFTLLSGGHLPFYDQEFLVK